MSMEKVEATYGAPTRRAPQSVAHVGEPPITRWEYPGFVVYFEHNIVVHTVATPELTTVRLEPLGPTCWRR